MPTESAVSLLVQVPLKLRYRVRVEAARNAETMTAFVIRALEAAVSGGTHEPSNATQ